jgi:hypothetical protein
MLDAAHSLILRSVADGDQDDSPALETLIATGLIARGEDGRVVVTPAGRIALEAGTDDNALWAEPQAPWIVAGLLGLVTLMFVVVNLVRGDALLNETQLTALPLVAIGFALWIAWARRAARRKQAPPDSATG